MKQTDNRSISKWEVLLFAVLVGILSTLLGDYSHVGYSYGLNVHSLEQIPMILRSMDHSYLLNDVFVNSSTEFGPRFYYVKFLGFLGSFMPLSLAFLFLTIISNSLVAFVTFFTARRLFNSSLSAFLSVTLVMAVCSLMLGFGSDLLHHSTLVSGLLALPMVLLALYAGISNRPFLCAFASAIASLFHPLVGVETASVTFAALLLSLFFSRRMIPNRVFGGDLWKILAAAATLGAFILITWVFPNHAAEYKLSTAEFVDTLARFAHPYHYLPSQFPLEQYVATIAFLVAFSIAWRMEYLKSGIDRRILQRILISVVVVIVLCIGGYVFVEIYPSRLWTTAQTFRLIFIIKWLGLIIAADTIAGMLGSHTSMYGKYPAWVILTGSGMLQPFQMLFGYVMEIYNAIACQRLGKVSVKIAMWFSFLVVFVAFVKYGSKLELMNILIFSAMAFWFLRAKKNFFRAVIPILFVTLIVSIFIIQRYVEIPVLSNRLKKISPIIFLSDVKGPFEEVAKYVNENTPKDALFVIPPLSFPFGRFRLVARRSVVVDYAGFLFGDKAMVEWRERLKDCYGSVNSGGLDAQEEMNELYKKTDDGKLAFLASKYDATHALLYEKTATGLPVLFNNGVYKVVKINDGVLRKSAK